MLNLIQVAVQVQQPSGPGDVNEDEKVIWGQMDHMTDQ